MALVTRHIMIAILRRFESVLLFTSWYDYYLKLVAIRLLTREERIIQLPPLKQAEFSIGPSSASNANSTMYNSSMTVLAASSLQVLEPRKTFTLNHSISGKLTMSHPKVCIRVCLINTCVQLVCC